MLPTYKPGEKVLVVKKGLIAVQKGAVVVAKNPEKRLVIKRVKKKAGDTFFLVGDNEMQSTDSRQFGWIEKKNIIGKVIFSLS